MMIVRIVVVALRNLLRQPFRTLLILQGVIWGTALGVFPPAVIHGSMHLAETQAQRLGTDRVLITQDTGAQRLFDWELVDRLRRDHAGLVLQLCAMELENDPLSPVRWSIRTDEHALQARGLTLAAGRFLNAADLEEARAVCVLEHEAAQRCFGAEPAVGQTISSSAGELQVIGVTASRAAAGAVVDELGYHREHPMRRLLDELKTYVGVFDDPALHALGDDEAVMVPHTWGRESRPRWIELRAAPKHVLPLRGRLQESLAGDGYEPVIYSNAILPVLYGETIKSLIQLNRTVFVLSVFVGTAIVCAIMVLSVVERQREIAIRRVEGARRWHIALQFVVETGTLCLVGGVAGVPLGLGLAAIRCALEPMGAVTWTVPPVETAVILTAVTAIGLAGGILPAWRAMRVDPVEMLRYE